MPKESTFAYKGSTALSPALPADLGEEFAEQLAEKGSTVLVGRSEDKLQALAQRLERQSKNHGNGIDCGSASSTEVGTNRFESQNERHRHRSADQQCRLRCVS